MILRKRFPSAHIVFAALVVAGCGSTRMAAQEQPAQPSSSGAPTEVEPKAATGQEPPGGKRVFGVLPNYRTADESDVYSPITARQKFTIASKDSFDYPLVMLAGGIAALGQMTDQNPSFGQGIKGYAHRLVTSYGDQAMGNMLTEAIYPSLFHEDPRFFRRAIGSTRSRTAYALSRIFVTRTDSGGTRFNFSEVLGNATGVAISNAYYPDGRTVGNNVTKLGEQLAIDALSQVLKEFWPDIRRKLVRHRDSAEAHP
ncbi:MAG: hypothetical protein DMG59_22670 [Acidobacteria bacterium]|nr:MAG: hypothetical protein DMG59_22670 [Acidobacteriota bacterium]